LDRAWSPLLTRRLKRLVPRSPTKRTELAETAVDGNADAACRSPNGNRSVSNRLTGIGGEGTHSILVEGLVELVPSFPGGLTCHSNRTCDLGPRQSGLSRLPHSFQLGVVTHLPDQFTLSDLMIERAVAVFEIYRRDGGGWSVPSPRAATTASACAPGTRRAGNRVGRSRQRHWNQSYLADVSFPPERVGNSEAQAWLQWKYSSSSAWSSRWLP